MEKVNLSQPPYVLKEHPLNELRPLRVIVKYLRNVNLIIYKKNTAIGGTWLENKYLGIRCDIPAYNYQFSWNLNLEWSEFYVTGPEILTYFQDTVKKHGLEKYVRLRHKVVGTVWNDEEGTWFVDVYNEATGEVFQDRGEFLINASGFLNNWKWPDIPGLNSFGGQLAHTADWKDDISLKGKTVAMIGNEAKQVVNFIRSPTWITPSFAQTYAGPGGTNFQYNPDKFLKYCKALEEEICARFDLVLKDSDSQAQAKALLAEYMKRVSPGIGYLEAMNETNVRVVLDPIDSVVKEGIRLKTGKTILIDVLICATGFDLSWKPRFPIHGRNGINLQDQFEVRPVGYLGISVPNMPNYLVYFGLNSPLAHGSVLPSFEHITMYMIRMIHKPSKQAISDFVEHADAFFPRTVWSTECRSWFKGVYALHPGSRVYWVYMMNEPRYEDYNWKTINRNKFAYLGNGFSLREVENKDITWFLDEPEAGYKSVIY
ncbi:putative monooxygenase [Fusarium tricinctum]|uniref:Monooxygenase n=1 Tax=Fusarium tricinctum TaxID=61284 RepID=A0A8K0RZB3_9HYPO|nr:putative monooxygenase [Fusarium tricinctum]